MPENTIRVGPGTAWANPFRYRDRGTGLVRYRPDRPDQFEFEGRISSPGMSHPYFGPDGTVVDFQVRWATKPEIVELLRRTLTEPDRGMLSAYPPRQGRFTRYRIEDIRAHLAGKNLACSCPQDVPCHADLLMRIVDEEGSRDFGQGRWTASAVPQENQCEEDV